MSEATPGSFVAYSARDVIRETSL